MFNNFYQNKKVLVTGHTGFKGSWLSHWLLEMGAEVAGYSLYVPSEPSNFEILNLKQRLHDHQGDIRDLEALQKVFSDFNPDIVFHLAAQPIVRTSFEEPRLTFETNMMGTINIIEAIRQTNSVQNAVLITSDKCYENVEWEYGYREDDRLGGKDPYSGSKACAEIAFSSYFRSFFNAAEKPYLATTRAGNVIGGGDWAKDRIVPDCVRAWSQDNALSVRNPIATRPWQHVLEPLSGYLWLGANLHQKPESLSGESFNFGPLAEVNQSVGDLIDEMKNTWQGGTWKDESHPDTLKKEAGLLKLCCDKVLNRLGWQASLGFSQTVKMTTEWYLNFYQNQPDMIAYTSAQIQQYVNLAKENNRSWALS